MFKPQFTPCGEDPQGRRNPLRRATPLARYAHLSDMCATRPAGPGNDQAAQACFVISYLDYNVIQITVPGVFFPNPGVFLPVRYRFGREGVSQSPWCYFCGTGGRGVSGRDGRTRRTGPAPLRRWMERRDVHARRFALFGLLAGLHAQNPCEPRVQAMYAASGHPPVMCGDAEKEQMEVARRWKGATPAHRRRWRNPKACPRETNFSTLEQLWPAGHFRGPLNGPRSYFKRVPPHFLGYHANFSNCRRKVYLDIGARQFDSKEGFLSMLKLYPPLLDFDEYYG